MMLQTDLSHWGILPLQYVHDSWYASIKERHWWFTFKKYACNDVAPGISTNGEGSGPRGWLNQRVPSVLHSIKEARQIQDWARLRFLRTDLQQLASQMSVPLYAVGSIVVPNLLPNQKSAIHRVSKKMVASITGPAWEKQALSKVIRILWSNPHTMRQIFASHATSHASRFDKTVVRPVCQCHDTPPLPGNRQIIQGHVAYTLLVPCEGTYLRPNDPLPLKGSKVCAQLIKDLTKCADQLGADLPPLHLHLPHSLWPKTGSALHTTRLFATVVFESHYVRIVDNGVGVMWGLCKHCVWSSSGRIPHCRRLCCLLLSAPQALSYIRSEVEKRGYSADS